MRNPNGFGSVYKLKGNRHRPYQAVITERIEYNPETGKFKQVRKTVGFYKTRAEGLSALTQYHDSPYNLDASKIKFREIYEKWSDEHYPEIADSTVKSYKAAYLLCAPIANMKITDIKLDDLQSLVDNSGKNAPALRTLKVLLGQIFRYAVIHDYIPEESNKTKYITLKNAGNPNALDREPFSTGEIAYLWEIHKANEYYTIPLMLIYSGVRISEMLDLKKENVNIAERFFSVTASKTQAGIRRVPIADKILPFFEYWFNKNDCEYLLSTPEDKHFTYRNYYDSYWTPLMKYVNMKHYPHDTRHTCISLLTAAGVDERIIRKIVGHKGIGVTQAVYTHLEMQILLSAINKI